MDRRIGRPQKQNQNLPSVLFQKLMSNMNVLIQLILRLYKRLLSFVKSYWERWTGPILTLDTGLQVRVGNVIAEGGFSIVFRATEVEARGSSSPTCAIYALKRIRCDEQETLQMCRREASVHREVQQSNNQHENVMPLLGMIIEDKQFCYMLFPYMPHSLRDEVNRRIFDRQLPQRHGREYSHQSTSRTSPFPTTKQSSRTQQQQQQHRGLDSIPPWNEIQALRIFRSVLDGIKAIHDANYTHRDIKLENILFRSSNNLNVPVITDLGSSGSLTEDVTTRRNLMNIVELASSHTTISYRPPELFEGGITILSSSSSGNGDDGNGTNNYENNVLDYTRVDIWSLGCVLYGMLYGASPFECEYNRSNGEIRIVDCTQLRVIGDIPYPPKHTGPYSWYSPNIIHEFIPCMLTQDRFKRPTLQQVIAKVDKILLRQQENQSQQQHSSSVTSSSSDSIDALINRNVM